MTDELCWRPAREVAGLLAAGELGAVELLEAHLAQIERVNPAVNAIVTLDPEAAMERARELDSPPRERGPLHGMPIAVKDLEDTAGMRTTYGSRLYREHVPERDSVLAERLRASGAVILGKTNTPEFGAGSQTFNRVFPPTRNPYDLGRTAGGSSGGAAAAVACAMTPLADGSDLAASVRNPAAFCNVVGLRPSPGRWATGWEDGDAWDPLSVLGPIARSVGDVEFFLEALAGADVRDPLSWAGDGEGPAQTGGLRVAWSPTLGGLPVERSVLEAVERARPAFLEIGAEVVDAEPDLDGADEAFDTLRALAFAGSYADLARQHPGELKDTIVWNVERGLALSPEEIARALRLRTRVFHSMRRFMEGVDVLVTPTVQVEPFSIDVDWVREIEGQPMTTYVEWLRSCSRITVTAHPAVSLPCGFTPAGLPVGLQLVGRFRQERPLLRVAAAFEAATGYGLERPPVAA